MPGNHFSAKMKTRIVVYLFLTLLIGAVVALKYFPRIFWESEIVVKLTGREIPPPVSSGEGSPILYAVLDLGGDGFAITPVQKTTVLFDHVGNGVRIGTMWIGANDALLALDLNGNGIVDNGTELIGNRFKAGSARAMADVFSALSPLDDNRDGVIDAHDASYSKLMLWQDINGDAICDATEMHALGQSGILSINTEPAATGVAAASMIKSGTYELRDPVSGAISSREFKEYDFKTDTFRRSFVTKVAVSPEVEWLPNLGGSGLVQDMHEAATLSPVLARKLTAFAGAETRDEQLGMLDDLIAEWGKSSGMLDMQTRAAQNGYTITTDLDAKTLAMLTVLEQFNGRGYFAMPWEEHIGDSARQGLIIGWDKNPKHLKIKLYPIQLQPLAQAYKTLKDWTYKALIKQTRLKPYFDAIPQNESDKQMSISFNPVVETFTGRFQFNPEKVIVDLIEFNDLMVHDPKMAGWQEHGSRLLNQLLAKVSPSTSLQKTLKDFSIVYSATGKLAGQES